MGNVRARIAESLGETRAPDAEIAAWHGDAGAVYSQWWVDGRQLRYLRRPCRYYVGQFDQRARPKDGRMTQTRPSADEVIWSCWKTAPKNPGVATEFYAAAPLPYIATQFFALTERWSRWHHELFADAGGVLTGQFAVDLLAIDSAGRVAGGELTEGAGQP